MTAADDKAFYRLGVIIVMIAGFVTAGILAGVGYIIWRMV